MAVYVGLPALVPQSGTKAGLRGPGAPSVGALFMPTSDSDDSVCFISTAAKLGF
jgi:hypothetical protein